MNRENILLLEYERLCEDWHTRDAYVMNKLTGSSLLFIGFGFVTSQTWEKQPIITMILLLFALLFTVIFAISVAKDVYLRTGTQKMIELIVKELGISKELATLRPFPSFGALEPLINYKKALENGSGIVSLDIKKKLKDQLRKAEFPQSEIDEFFSQIDNNNKKSPGAPTIDDLYEKVKIGLMKMPRYIYLSQSEYIKDYYQHRIRIVFPPGIHKCFLKRGTYHWILCSYFFLAILFFILAILALLLGIDAYIDIPKFPG